MPIIFSSCPGGFSPASETSSMPAGTFLVGPTPAPITYPAETFTLFYQSILSTLKNTNIFGPYSVFYVLEPEDADIRWPSTPPPYALVVPGEAYDAGDGIGGGRFAKDFQVEFEIWIVTRNILDDAWHDTDASTTNSQLTGSYPNIDAVLNLIEQSYPLDVNGRLSMIELPYCLKVGKPARFPKANEYIYIPMYFRCRFCSYLPAILP